MVWPAIEVPASAMRQVTVEDMEFLFLNGVMDNPLVKTQVVSMPELSYFAIRFLLAEETLLVQWKDEFGIVPGLWTVQIPGLTYQSTILGLEKAMEIVWKLQEVLV